MWNKERKRQALGIASDAKDGAASVVTWPGVRSAETPLDLSWQMLPGPFRREIHPRDKNVIAEGLRR